MASPNEAEEIGPPPPAAIRRPIARFNAYLETFSGGGASNPDGLSLKMGIPAESKYDAMRFTDFPGWTLEVEVRYVKRTAPEDDPDYT